MTTTTPITLSPERATFVRQAAAGGLLAIALTRSAHGESAPAIFRRLDDEAIAYLLETLPGDAPAVMGLAPLAVLRAEGRQLSLVEDGVEVRTEGDPLEALSALLKAYAPAPGTQLPRLAGAVGYFGYDTVRHIERLPELAAPGLPMPEAYWIIPGQVIELDPAADRLTLLQLLRLAPGEDAESAYARGVAALEALDARLQAPLRPQAAPAATEAPVFIPGMSEDEFKAHAESLKEHIRAGDIFQAVLSQRFEARTHAQPFAIYEQLRQVNPSPHSFFLRFPEASIAGASPELLYKLEAGTLTVRPIAGTRRRGATPAEDAELEASLRADPKELAEHVMLVDLGRNDVGRVAELGSVRVVDQLVVERYSHVMHLVSSVQGRLPAGRDALDAFRATFPAGTLSGAPKVRAMELIESHEPVRRGLYGGTIGLVGFNGDAQLAIAIRTLVACQGRLYFQTGAGIVYDSDPAKEYQETLDKARALREAIADAHGRASAAGARDGAGAARAHAAG